MGKGDAARQMSDNAEVGRLQARLEAAEEKLRQARRDVVILHDAVNRTNTEHLRRDTENIREVKTLRDHLDRTRSTMTQALLRVEELEKENLRLRAVLDEHDIRPDS